ncbi:MAG: TenA family protein [Chloroflexaceae bacterium]|nr:TenA family protein [Chloroflexaceae bacterium]
MTLSQDLWQEHQSIVAEMMHDPFIEGIADASLSHQRFTYAMRQEGHYLETIARVYSIAAAKAPGWESFGMLHSMADRAVRDVEMYYQFAPQLGVDVVDKTLDPTMHRFTDFLLSTAWGQDIGLTVVALVPWQRAYDFIGDEISHHDIPEHGSIDWLRNCTDPGRDLLIRQLEDLIDHYARPTPVTYNTYQYALQCQRDFFQAAWDTEPDAESEE